MRTFELWIEGYNLSAAYTQKARKVADVTGVDFNDAVDKYVETLTTRQAACWEYNEDDQCWEWSGRRAYDNEKAARTIYG